ncbi:MAG TPA: type III secretion system inner membrane ring subunit SctD [Trinickia sp.]|jgi:type III secretion protein D|nr:type III secretion system inner membrane ring subunit SctD [Trinickia sp.]
MDGGYKLRWLNGLLAGREFVLPAGEIRLGGSDADIAVTLETDGEAVLVVDDDGVRLSSEQPVWVDGNRWDAHERLPLQVAIDVAGQAFVLGAVTDILATVPVPARHSRTRRLTPLTSRVLGCAAASIAVLGIVAALYAWQPTGEAKRPDVGAELVERLQQGPLHGLRIARDRDGVAVLSGYCSNSADVDRLRQQVQEQGLLVRDETVCADVLRRSVRDVLLANDYQDVDVEDGAVPESVVIRGDFDADSRWRSTVDQLRAIRGLGHWSIVNDRAESFEKLLQILTEHDLLDGISISISGRTLFVSGALPPLRSRMMEDDLAAYNGGLNGLRAQFQAIPGAADTAGLLPAGIASVGGNADSLFVQLENGMRLQRGAVLQNGFVVYALSRSFIALRKGERLISLPLGL